MEDELNPARVELGAVLALYVDQETAERGYILTGRPEFLEPYDAAGPQIETMLDELRRQVSGPVDQRITEMDEAHQTGSPRRWSRSSPPRGAATPREPRSWSRRATASSSSTRSRSTQKAADQAIAAEQHDATVRADTLLRRLSILLGFTILAFLATVLLGAGAFSRRVLGPLADLGRSSRAVAGGELQVAVRGSGPREVAEVGEDVDTMRRHLLDELDATRRASEALVLGQPAVRALQAALSQLPPVAAGIEVGSQIDSAEGVLAGDFLDIVDLGRGQVAVVLGDVSGHGPEAAVVGLRLKSALSAMLRQSAAPDVLAAVRAGLGGESELFATVFVAVVDTAADRLSYVNAGHPPPLLVVDGGLVELQPTGPLVSGVLTEPPGRSRAGPFSPGDRARRVLRRRDRGAGRGRGRVRHAGCPVRARRECRSVACEGGQPDAFGGARPCRLPA